MNNLTKKRKKKGFTLVELMAVVAIIAILAVVLVPTVTGYIERAKKTAVISQARTVVSAVELYNATASSPIEDSESVSTAATKTGELQAKDTNKLGNITIGTVRRINNLTDPLSEIKLTSGGIFSGIVNDNGNNNGNNNEDN